MKRFFAAALAAFIATPAHAITLDALVFEDCAVSVSLPDRPKVQARFDARCPSGLWVLAPDGGSIVCVDGDTWTTVTVADEVCPVAQ